MILHDFSSLIHRAIHNSIKYSSPRMQDGKYITEDFIPAVINRIMQELIELDREHTKEFGELVICLDDHSKKYWRNDFYVHYKENRKGARDESDIDYKEVFKYINDFVDALKKSSPWKVFEVPGAEADDTMAILAKRFCQYEKVLIQSPDKDMIQLHKYSSNIRQYSSLTNKWITEEDKGSGEDWLLEHVCLGDTSDGVPRIVDHLEFSENFKSFLGKKGFKICPSKFNDLPTDKQDLLTVGYEMFLYNKKGEQQGLDLFVKPRFGISNLKKEIDKFGSLDKYLDSNPLLRKHYERNATLVLEQNMPQSIIEDTIIAFADAKSSFKIDELKTYFRKFNLRELLFELDYLSTKYSSSVEELSIDNHGWL